MGCPVFSHRDDPVSGPWKHSLIMLQFRRVRDWSSTAVTDRRGLPDDLRRYLILFFWDNVCDDLLRPVLGFFGH